MQKLEEFNKNIISWYPFEKTKKLLQIGENIRITEELKEKVESVSMLTNEEGLANIQEKFYYILIYKNNILEEKANQVLNLLEEDGKILMIDNNDWAIHHWCNYDAEKTFGNSEKEKKRKTTINKLKKNLYSQGINHINTFFAFPNCENAELIINEKFNIQQEQIGKYLPTIEKNQIKTLDEIKVLKTMIQVDPELLFLFTNAYVIEASKTAIQNDVRYVSYNNARKEEYRLITILRENVVEKIPANKQASKQIENMKENIREIKETNIALLDYEENEKICSQLIKNEKTVDVILAEKAERLEEIVAILKEMQNDLKVDVVSYEEAKKMIEPYIEDGEEEKIKKLHFVKKAFIDMIPKNCFYREGKYWYFDQEWKRSYLPVEYITYRAIINSYELVKKIKVQELLGKLEIDEYIGFFKKLDNAFREEVMEATILQEMYGTEEVKSVENLMNDLKMYQENNEKQDKAIKDLEEDNQKKQNYIEALEQENKRKQEYIETLEASKEGKLTDKFFRRSK